MAKKTTKKPAAKKNTAAPPKAAAAPEARAKPNTIEVNEQERRLFVDTHLPKIKNLKEKLNTANANLRNAYKAAKSDGFSKQDFETAIALEDAEKEAASKARIARQLVIARYMGSDLGKQLELFLDEAPVPIVDRARAEGVAAASAKGKAKPDYAPGTEAYDAFMEGYHSVNEKNAAGIKPTKPKEEAEEPPEPTSGVAMSRSQFLAQQEAAKKAAAADDDEGSAFSKRTH